MLVAYYAEKMWFLFLVGFRVQQLESEDPELPYKVSPTGHPVCSLNNIPQELFVHALQHGA